ncbi:MAG: sulfatase [Saprospiraceae bacterium]|nr:MAG: sulfatase [Saprospiraceae bacterium]
MRYFLLTFISLAFVANLTAQSQPNIVFIQIDDLGYHDLSCTGSKIYQTPNIDRLAKQSLTFKQAYSSYPRCTPSRYGLITGTYPVNEDHGNLADIKPEQNFVNLLNKAGYQTYYVGKWHLGEGENEPTGFGFNQSFAAGSTGGVGSRFYPFNTRGNAEKGDKAPVPDVEKAGKEGDYLSDLLTTATIDFIKKSEKDKPFFAMLSFYAVHTPLEAKDLDKKRNQKEIDAFDFGDTPEYIKEGTGRRKMRQDDADYAGMVENVDENVGRLLAALQSLDLSDNTIIVLSSDHGGLSNDGERLRHLATTNAPLRAGKGHLYEGGIRVPLILHWEGKIAPGVDEKNIILGMDVFPTLLDLAIAKKVEGIDGKSYLPVMNGKESWENRTVYWHSQKARPHSTGDSKCSVVRSGDYKLLHFFKDDRIELYNLKEDISEEKNLAQEEPERVKKMLTELKTWKKQYLIPEKMDMKKMAKQRAKAEKKH